jgi:GNAT superfamily N-acetyltransferase
MIVRNLNQTSREEIYEAFTLAFKNYVVPIEFQEEATYRRWEEIGVDFNLSFGAFDGKRLVAFILQVPYGRTLHNFGTGVIPSHRGQHLTQKIYERIVSESIGYDTFSLEVIRDNTKALNLYRKLGFEIKRELVCLKGTLSISEGIDPEVIYEIHPLSRPDELPGLSFSQPATENSFNILEKNPHLHELHLLKKDNETLAYAYYTPASLSLRDLGAGKPSEKNLDQLLGLMKLQHEKLRVMNIDSGSPLIPYLEERGLLRFVTQYEMKRNIFI